MKEKLNVKAMFLGAALILLASLPASATSCSADLRTLADGSELIVGQVYAVEPAVALVVGADGAILQKLPVTTETATLRASERAGEDGARKPRPVDAYFQGLATFPISHDATYRVFIKDKAGWTLCCAPLDPKGKDMQSEDGSYDRGMRLVPSDQAHD